MNLSKESRIPKILRNVTKYIVDIPYLRRLVPKIETHYSKHPFRFEINDYFGHIHFSGVSNEHISQQMYWRGGYAKSLVEKLLTYLSPGTTFIDVGANKGVFTLAAASVLAKTEGNVIAYEPATINANALEYQLSLNSLSNVKIIRKGLGNTNEIKQLYSPDRDATNALNEGMFTVYQNSKTTVPIENITITTLDDQLKNAVIKPISVIKLDIEGGELQALKGAEHTIKHHKPVILLEISVTENSNNHIALYQLFVNWGYQIISPSGITLQKPEELLSFRDVFCLPVFTL